MLIEKACGAVRVTSRPNPEQPLRGGCRGFVAVIEHRNQYDNKSADNCFCHFVVFADSANDFPRENTHRIEMQHTKGDKESVVYCYAENIGDQGV